MPLASRAVTVTTTATLLSSSASVVLVRPTSGDIYIGGPGVTAAAGMLVKQDEVFDDILVGSEADALYAITASGSASVRVFENSR